MELLIVVCIALVIGFGFYYALNGQPKQDAGKMKAYCKQSKPHPRERENVYVEGVGWCKPKDE